MQWSPPAARERREPGGAEPGRVGESHSSPRGQTSAGSGAPAHRRWVPRSVDAALRHPRVRRLTRRVARVPRLILATIGLTALVAVLAIPSLLDSGSDATPGIVADVGAVDFSFAANGVKAPTGRKPEAAKLWFNDGSWWGSLFLPARDAYVIQRFDADARTWIDTGVILDDRNASRADLLWDGEHLYAISGGIDPRSAKHAALFMRFSYDQTSRSYALDRGFPVLVTEGGAETFVLDRDDLGRTWVTFTRDREVYVTHTVGDDREWLPPYPLPVAEAQSLAADDISTVIAYEGAVGVMWSDQIDGAIYFASLANGAADDAWTVSAAVQGPTLADDHMNLKALRDDPAGQVFAVVKTSRNDEPNAAPGDPLILLLVLTHEGTWQQHVVGTVKDDATRPLLLVDTDHRELYVFTSGPCCSGGTIYYKTARLDAIEFPGGTGTPFIRRGSPGGLNNPTSTKQNVGIETGLLVLASDDKIDTYMHNYLRLDGPAVPRPTLAPGPSSAPAPGQPAATGEAVQAWLVDGFEEPSLRGWTTLVGPSSVARVETGVARTDRRALRLRAGTAPDARAAARFELPAPQPALKVGLDIRLLAEGPVDSNVPLVRLFDPAGARILSVYRQNHKDGRVWVGIGDDHVPTSARMRLETWTRLDLELRPGVDGATLEVRIDGRPVGEIPLASAPSVMVVQVGNDSKEQPFDLVVDNVKVDR